MTPRRPYFVPASDAREIALELVKRHGTIAAAGRDFSRRHGYAMSSGQRILVRVIHEATRVTSDTYDRLWVML